MLTSRNVWKCAFHLTKTWNIAKSRNKEWRQPNIGKTSNDARIITLKSNPSRGTALPAPHGKGNKCEFTRKRQIIRYRATATLRRPQNKQYSASKKVLFSPYNNLKLNSPNFLYLILFIIYNSISSVLNLPSGQRAKIRRGRNFPCIQYTFNTTLNNNYSFLCCLRSIAAHRDHFVRRLSVHPSVCVSVCPVVTLSW